jgi:hypothetical protein
MTDTKLSVLGVHGIRYYQMGLESYDAAELVAGWWRNALAEGLGLPSDTDAFSLEVAYYAHRLHQRTAQGEEDPALLDTETQQMIVEWSRLLGAPDAVAQGRLTAPARAAITWVADTFGLDHAPARILATTFFREVQTYFTDQGIRQAAQADVADAITRSRPNVIIAHSLGSVVAYETLWAHPHPPVGLFLTLGSPLAMPGIVHDRLAPHDGPRTRPPGVQRWINVADPGDIIAIPTGGIPRRFGHVTADLTDAIGAFGYHRVTKYLACGAVTGVISAQLPS